MATSSKKKAGKKKTTAKKSKSKTSNVSSKKSSQKKRAKVKKSSPKRRRRRSNSIRNPLLDMTREEDLIDIKILKDSEKTIFHVLHSFFRKHVDNYESIYGKALEGTFFALNFLAIILFIIDTHNISDTWRSILWYSELALVSCFILEYGVRMWVAEKRFRHFFSVYSIIDLISIVPILINFVNLTFFRVFRMLRLLRLVRILRFQRIFKDNKTMFGTLSDSELIVVRIVMTIFTIIFVFAGLIWAVESTINPEHFATIWHALYFAIVTLSTVGYGDVVPLSAVGRGITVVMILSGVALIPWQLGKLLKVVVKDSKRK